MAAGRAERKEGSHGALGPIVFTAGLAAGELAPAVVAHTALLHGGDRGLAGLDRVAVAAAYATSGLMLGLASALVTALRAHGCSARAGPSYEGCIGAVSGPWLPGVLERG